MPIATEITNENEPPSTSRKQEQSARKTRALSSSADALGKAESTEYSSLAARATNDALRDWDVKTGALAWPQGLENLLGHADSPNARTLDFWREHLHPGDRARVLASIEEALASADRWSGEYRFQRGDGSYLQLFERAVILRDAGGEAVRFVGSLMDVTARKQLCDQVLRSQKMEAFGQLAGGVAHDFNNFLTTILGYSDLLLSDGAIKGEIAKHLREIQSAAGRASALTAQLLAFSRRNSLYAEVLEVNTLVTNLEHSLVRLLGENIEIECRLRQFADGGYIKVDRGQITQILLNLLANARDAMPRGGKVILATESLLVTETQLVGENEEPLAPGEYLSISVTDTGSGMSEDVKAHLFEPFYSSETSGQRSGLGLAASYGIVRQSGGHIRAQSAIDEGTTVTIFLPRVPPPAYKKPNGKKLATGTETILVLEDDIGVRHISVRVLRGLGYHVIEAANAEDAQRLIAELGVREIHLLLTDVIMPQMSGDHFADWLREASPQTKVIFISGYLDVLIQLDTPRDAKTFFLPKPFDSHQLAAKVREALDAKVDG